jgi:hypothetical protein
MRVKLKQIVVLGLALGVMSLSANAQGRDGGGIGGAVGGAVGAVGGVGNAVGGAVGNAVGGTMGGVGNPVGGAVGGAGNAVGGALGYGPYGYDRGDWNRWAPSYYSYYGRGWDYRPDFGWGINIPLGRFGDISIGNYYGYNGYPYYGWGNWNYWGPYGYYGSWSPGYDDYGYDYGYDYSSPAYAVQLVQQYGQTEQTQGQLPPVPTSKEVSRFTDQQLRSFIAWVANGFTHELGQFSTGDTWVKFLQLNELKDMSPRAPGDMATAKTSGTAGARIQNKIDSALDRFNTASKNEEYKAITNTWGFQALQVALKEAARSPQEREPDVLKGQAEMLNKSLERLSTGDGWRKHLELDSLQKLADKKNLESNDEIKRIEERFDQTAHNPDFQSIAKLPGFSGVYGTLHKLTEGRQPESTAKRVSGAQH